MGKPCAFTNQGLAEHSKGSLEWAKKVLSDSYFRVTKRRLEKFGVEVTKEDMEVAVLLHDMGKAAEYYQGQFDDGCNPLRGRPTFIYHEIGSALFFYKNVKDEGLRTLVTLTELNHLNAVRGVSQLNPAKLPVKFDEGMLKLRKYGQVLLEELSGEYPVGGFRVDDYTFYDYNEMLEDLSRVNEPYLKLYSLFLAPVIVGDNLDSSHARSKEERRRFIRMLEKELGGVSP
ncbi:CRISPR-associated endonuclease Cas3'' [Stygiolobus caldivivus]|uniref:CRISPR-associated endonuclease Cas3 n=1 Tax=Stygiolobus caldivivus TaxID=2824673 RepID=A0A8D5U6M3_9CREN|nr:CRISPR-associated endonuclease Cas3'' [Stygiolobus caldivivus]BCU69801.1 CRISPR-associated endonuclease Cas3'' [Stygiolobus caldivivus]